MEILTSSNKPRYYFLEPEEVRVAIGKPEKIFVSIPYWTLSAKYSRHSRPKEKSEIIIAKMIIWSFIPVLVAYCAVSIPFSFLWLIVAVLLIPLWTLLKAFIRPHLDVIVFYEDLDGHFAFDIEYEAKDEEKVVQFMASLQEKLESFSKQRSVRRKNVENGLPEEDEE